MLRVLHAIAARTTAHATLLLLGLVSVQARAEGDTLYMRIDGVSAGGTASTPLGADAFPVLSFTVGAGKEAPGALPAPGPVALDDVIFNMSVVAGSVPMWSLAVQGKVVPSASLVAVDGTTGKIRYRVDLEQVFVRTLGLQTLGGTREAIMGSLGYERIRLTQGEGKDAVSSGWDRVRNVPWK